jgi:uridine monophosphate synthetase
MLWSAPDQLGFVVAANDKLTLEKVRDIAPNRWILSPGVGAQGANIRDVIEASGGSKLIIPISRAISGSTDPNIAATKFAEEMRAIRSRQVNKGKRVSFSVKERVAYDLFDRGCVKFGQFKLKSGAISPIYVDLRMLVSHPDLLAQIAELYKEELRNKSFDALAALPYAALPIGTAISLSMNKPMLYPRKEQKSYGTCSLIEGEYKKGIKAVVIDDVVTKGDSKLEVIQVLEANGIIVDDVCVLIDREGGGREALESRGKKLISIFKFSELLDAWRLSERITQEQYESVSHFLSGT